MRDLDRVKERIEVRLEPKQVVTFIVVSVLFCGGLFAGGYLLGRSSAPTADVSIAQAQSNPIAAPVIAAPASVAVAAPTTAALGEVEFMFPNALGDRPARHKAHPKTMNLPAAHLADGKARSKAAAKTAAKVVEKAKATKLAKAAEKKKKAKSKAKIAKATQAAKANKVAKANKAAKARAKTRAAKTKTRAAKRRTRPAPVAARAALRSAMPPAAMNSLDEDRPAKRSVAPAAYRSAKVAKAPAKPTRRRNASSRYTVQLKAASERSTATSYAAQLRQSGFKPHIVMATVPGRGRFYRVRLGDFESRQAARAFQRRFRQKSGRADAGFITEL